MDASASEPRLAPDRHDVVLALALGALACTGHFVRDVQATIPDGDGLQPDDPVVLASLGIIALRRSIHRWLEHAATPPPLDSPSPADARPSSRELLR
jgi:hypothetical protein